MQETSKKAEEKLTKEMGKEQDEDKMRPVLETFSESAVDMDPYLERFNRHVDELRWLYMELYNNDYMFDDLCKNMYGFYQDRKAALKNLDQKKGAETGLVQAK